MIRWYRIGRLRARIELSTGFFSISTWRDPKPKPRRCGGEQPFPGAGLS